MVSISLVLARPGRPISSACPPHSTVIKACSTTRSCPKITLPIASLAAATCAPVASAWRTIMSSSFSNFTAGYRHHIHLLPLSVATDPGRHRSLSALPPQ